MTLEELLVESPTQARHREQSAFTTIAGEAVEKIILFGAGRLGRKVLAAIRRHGLEPVVFADNQTELHGLSIEGVQVISPEDAAKRFGATATFIVTIFRGAGDGGMESRLRQLKQLGCARVTSFLTFAWNLSGILPHNAADLPSKLLEHAVSLQEIGLLWGDEISRETFRSQLAWRLRDDFSSAGNPAPNQYFPRDVLAPVLDEQFVDCGAYDGDTLGRVPWGYSRAWAIEPDPLSASRLRLAVDQRVTVIEVALAAASGSAQFSALGGVDSALAPDGGASVRVETLDALLDCVSPTFVKLDIEGAEKAALAGGRGMLTRTRPVVAVCAYHRPDDIWAIPLFLRDTLPEHRLFLRAHENDGFELVVYAVPAERCVP